MPTRKGAAPRRNACGNPYEFCLQSALRKPAPLDGVAHSFASVTIYIQATKKPTERLQSGNADPRPIRVRLSRQERVNAKLGAESFRRGRGALEVGRRAGEDRGPWRT